MMSLRGAKRRGNPIQSRYTLGLLHCVRNDRRVAVSPRRLVSPSPSLLVPDSLFISVCQYYIFSVSLRHCVTIHFIY